MGKLKIAAFSVPVAATLSLTGLAITQHAEISDLQADLTDSDQVVSQLTWEIDTAENY